MEKINLTFVHLHSPLFFARKNWGDKLDTNNIHRGKIELVYDRDVQELMIKCGDKVAFIPATNIVSYEPEVTHNVHSLVAPRAEMRELNLQQEEPARKKPGPKPKIPDAQVSTPTSHVFAGPGAGKTNER